MDGEKNFISGGRSDDDGGIPVQDEHPASDSAGRQSEDQRVCVSAAKRKKFLSDSEDEEEDEEKPVVKKSRVMSDDDNDSNGSNSKSGYEDEQLIADIFGASEDEDEEDFMGFDKEHLEGDKQTKEKTAPQEEKSDSVEGVDHSGQHFITDFDIMLARRKAMKSRRRVGGISISDADDVVFAMIAKMTEAAEEDRTLNIQNKLATKKLLLLPQVVKHLKKQDLKETFLDCGVMSAIKEWISPLPDKSLPILNIREEMLKILQQLTSVSQQTLKHSGIGRAVMFLYEHPKETRSNKELALKLIQEWSRPIFGVTSNIRELTREERLQRDLDQQMPKRRCLSSGGQTPRRNFEKQLTGEEKALSPGYPDVCKRARVPMPSNKVYVVRPKWNVQSNRVPKNGMMRLDKQVRRLATIRRQTMTSHAVKISINGNRL